VNQSFGQLQGDFEDGANFMVAEKFHNTEYKSYEFASEEMVQAGKSKYALVETEESTKRHHVRIRK
jgi:hypothetical protein